MAWEESSASPVINDRKLKWYLLEDADNRVKWFTGIILLVSLAFLIAGSVMLGIGISKNNSNPSPPVNSQSIGYTMFLTVQTRSLPYSAVVSNYNESVQNLTSQMQQAISTSSSSRGSSFAAQPNVPITILGISNAGQWADVIYALSYTDATKPSLSDIQKKVTSSGSFAVISATDKTSPDLSGLSCASVADQVFTTTPASSTAKTGTPFTVTQQTGSTVSSNPGSVSTLSPPVTSATKVTEPARTTTTSFVKTPYSEDVIILLDDSKAMLTPKNFNSVKSWIVKTLLPLWLIDRNDVQIAFATYAYTEFNDLLNFDEANDQEVASVISAQMYSGKYNSSITFGIRAAGGIHGLRPVNQSAILISASEDLTDIESATQFASILNTLPNKLITISLNSATEGKQLGLLSTNQNHYFGVKDFNLTIDIAQQLTQYMFGTVTPTSVVPTASTVPDNACKADATILLDNNNDVGSIQEYQNQVRFVSKLIKTWPISPELMEGEAVIYATSAGGQIIENSFAYQSASAFANEVMAFDDSYFAISPPNLTASLGFLSSTLSTRRADREQTTIVFTYSSDNSDVQNAMKLADTIGGNLIIVAIGNADQNILKQLTGNVIYAKNLTVEIIAQVNNLLCSPSTRAPIITSTTTLLTSTSTSTVATTSIAVTTSSSTGTPTSTTPLPDPCPDCSPKTSNILLLLEAYGSAFNDQKNLTTTDLIATWNHFERTSIIGFDTLAKFLDPINFGELQSKDEFVEIVNALSPFDVKPTIVSAFNLAVNRAHPLKMFGKMNSVIFTSGATAAEISSAKANSDKLRGNGKVIIVGLKLADATGLDTICDVLLEWDDFSDKKTISAQVNNVLNS